MVNAMTRLPETGGRRRLVLSASTRHDVETGLPVLLELAAALHSELTALFVTDEAQLAACALPFPSLVSFSGGTFNFDPDRFEAAVRHEAEACRRILAHAAERARLAWTFETLRGESMRLMREASTVGDILVINYGRLAPSPAEMIAMARDLVPRRGGVLFVRGRIVRRDGPLVLIEPPDSPTDGLAQFAGALACELGASVSWATQAVDEGYGDFARARLLLGTIESPLLDNVAGLQRIMSNVRPPLLLMRSDFDE